MAKITTLLKTSDVNKYDAFIYDYLVQHKQLILEKIGSLQVSADQKPSENTGSATPAVDFTYDRKAETDPLLLDYIAERAGKNRALVAADLSSYLEQVRQFINIGKPYVIPGVGAIFMLKDSSYDFSQQSGVSFAASPSSAVLPEHYLEADPSETGRIRKKNSLAGLAFVVLVLVAGGAGWGIYNLVKGDGSTKVVSNEEASPAETTPVSSMPPVTDSIATNRSDSAAAVVPPVSVKPAGTPGVYKFIFETTASSERARVRTATLLSYGDPAGYDSVRQSDNSYLYRLFYSHKVPTTDTALIRDTLQRYFQKPVVIE